MGESRSDLRITKAGNRRLRTELVELSWRFCSTNLTTTW